MSGAPASSQQRWRETIVKLLPFADAATTEAPLSRLLRLSLFQVSVGMAAVLLTGTLNRVMIVELKTPAMLVALMVSLPLVFAPLRALIGHKSDTHRSALGWRRSPYIWFGTLMQFGGFAILPFALIVMSGDTTGAPMVGTLAAGIAFLLVGAGMHTVQTSGLALATDIAPVEARPRVVALLYVMLLLGTLISAVLIGGALADFSQVRLIQVVQGAGVLTLILNVTAMWKQEARDPARTRRDTERPEFSETWKAFSAGSGVRRLLVAVGLGAAAFGMQDVLLEPYGAQVLGLSVSATTGLTALSALGALAGFALAARLLKNGLESHRLAGLGALAGVAAFSLLILSGAFGSANLFRVGAAVIGFGGGLFSVGTLTAAMALAESGRSGIALGAWGAVQATCAGCAILVGGVVRDTVAAAVHAGIFGPAVSGPAPGYLAVYQLEIALLFVALAVIGPLARHVDATAEAGRRRFGLTEFPT